MGRLLSSIVATSPTRGLKYGSLRIPRVGRSRALVRVAFPRKDDIFLRAVDDGASGPEGSRRLGDLSIQQNGCHARPNNTGAPPAVRTAAPVSTTTLRPFSRTYGGNQKCHESRWAYWARWPRSRLARSRYPQLLAAFTLMTTECNVGKVLAFCYATTDKGTTLLEFSAEEEILGTAGNTLLA
jgi:hypothetical protein